MMRPTMCFLMAVCVVFLAGGVAQAGEKMLAHDVFFTLKDRSPEAKANLVAACKKYLTGHPGTVWFAVGPLAEEFNRDVNDRQFDVALHLVFKDKAAHDQYAKAERHMKFIEEMEATWEKVRVFDSYVDGFDHGTVSMTPEGGEQPRKFFLPDQAASFAGMIQGEVTKKGDGEFVLKVEKIAEVWEHSKARDPKALVGKQVVVESPVEQGKVVESAARFIRSLKVGEKVTVDVAHRKGETLTLLELTEDQRKRAEQ